MAAPLVDPLLHRLRQTTSTAGRAAALMRSAFPAVASAEAAAERGKGGAASGSGGLTIWLPRRSQPTHVLANQTMQPWELLPFKAAAMAQYPNFFNNSCTFFGSLKRDVVNGLSVCLVRPTKLAVDLAKVVRNLGIVEGFEVVQKRNRLGEHDFVWPRGQEPRDARELALFRHALLRLQLRADLYSLRGGGGAASGGPAPAQLAEDGDSSSSSSSSSSSDDDAAGVRGRRDSGSQASSSSSSGRPPSTRLAPVFGQLPLSVRNVSRASQPVMMYPRQLEEARKRVASGIFVMYHHELGLITDAQAEHYDVPGLVAAHVGLPLGMVAQIRGALRAKAAEQAGTPLRHVTQLKDWSLVEHVQREIASRQHLFDTPAVAQQQARLEAQVSEARRAKHAALVGANIGQRLEDELLAWEVLHSLGLGDTSASVGAGSDDAGKRAWQQQPSQQREGGRDWGRGGPSERRS